MRTFLALFACVVLAAAAQADSKSQFNGRWSVRVTGNEGECLVAYSLLFDVDGTRLIYAGSRPIIAEGKIDRRGKVRVRFRSAQDDLRATGTLRKLSGAGRWTNVAAGCGGNWTAQRTTG